MGLLLCGTLIDGYQVVYRFLPRKTRSTTNALIGNKQCHKQVISVFVEIIAKIKIENCLRFIAFIIVYKKYTNVYF